MTYNILHRTLYELHRAGDGFASCGAAEPRRSVHAKRGKFFTENFPRATLRKERRTILATSFACSASRRFTRNWKSSPTVA